MDEIKISRIERIDPRLAWGNEAHHFTPWLAREENFRLLADALHLFDAEVEATEYRVGDFSADIVAKDRDGLLLVENQLAQTDHTHLGQIITYIAGLGSTAKVVWISTRVREEHRAAIDWLNDNTSEDYSFFAVELELVRIGASDVAPLFHVISKPNFWTRHANRRATGIVEGGLTDRQKKYEEFWSKLARVIDNHDPTFRSSNPPKDHWWQFPTGRSGYSTTLTAGGRDHYAGVELYIHNDEDKEAFEFFLKQKSSIENDLGPGIEWERLDGKKGSRVVRRRKGIDPFDETQQKELFEWYWEELNAFRRVFLPLLRSYSE